MKNSAPHFPRHRVLVVGKTRMDTLLLPDLREIVIGRGDECDIRIDDPTLEERHAVLSVGPHLSLTALAEATITVGGTPLGAGQSARVSPGVVLTLGGVTLVLQSAATSTRLRHVRTHDYFQGRVEEESARSDQRGGAFAVARFLCAEGAAERVEGLIASAMRPMDVLATYAPRQYEMLVLELEPSDARLLVDDIVARVRAAGETVETLLACYPRDARTPDALFASLSRPARDAEPTRRLSEMPPSLAPVPTMDRLRPVLERVAASTISILVLGETGVGKEVMATTIHSLSPRRDKPLLSLNCAAVSENLLESELFGYERGAFTGAVTAKPGLFETANGGTVFFDEVGDMPLSVQARLLRVIEQRQVTRLGAVTARPIDVRFIAATNVDLERAVSRGTFRRDLFFRLNGFILSIPPLRERASEIGPLARAFIEEAAKDAGRPPPRLSNDALRALQSYTWPGNIRELRNTLQRAVLLCVGDVIDKSHLPMESMGRTVAPSVPPPPATPPSGPAVPSTQSGDERERILRALEQCGGNQTKAALVLGISRRTLISRIESYGVPRPKKAT